MDPLRPARGARLSRNGRPRRRGRVARVPAWRRWSRRLGLPALALLVLGGGVAFAAARQDPAPAPVIQARPTLGRADAQVVLVEYADFQCPFCGAFAREVKPLIEEAYVRTGKIRFEWRDFASFGEESKAAANAARCAGDQDAFWQYHDRLFAERVTPNRGTFSRARLISDASAIGLDLTAFTACLDDGRHRGAVEADTAEAARLGMTGTPTFIIGGRRIVGAQRFEVFAGAIESALAAAKQRQ